MLYRSTPAAFTFLLVDATGKRLQPSLLPAITITRTLDSGPAEAATGTTTLVSPGWYRYDLSAAETDCERASFLIESPGALTQTRDLVFLPRDFAGVPRGQPFPGFTFSLLSRDGINPPEPGYPDATVSSDGGPIHSTTNIPVWVGGERYRIDLSAADLAGRSNHFVISMLGAIPARFTLLTVA